MQRILKNEYNEQNEKQTEIPDSKKDENSNYKFKNLLIWVLGFNFIIIYQTNSVLIYNIYYLISKKFSISISNTGYLLTINFFIPIFLTPIFGWISFKIGKNIHFMFFSSVLLLFSLIFLTIPANFFYLIISLILISIFYSIYPPNVWSYINLSIPKKNIATIIGIIECGMNIIVFLSSIIYGEIFDITVKYNKELFYPLVYLISLSLIGVISIFPLFYFDSKRTLENIKINENIK